MNNVSLIGRPTSDPEVKYTQGQNGELAISVFTLAVDNPFNKEKPDFIRVKGFNQTAEFIEKYVSKGVRVGLTGRIQTDSYQHKDGYMVYTTDVVASNIFFCDKKEETAKPAKPAYSKGGNRNSGNQKSR